MLSKAQIKYIRSLTQQKYRKEHNVFLAEGEKVAAEWLDSGADIRIIAALEGWLEKNAALLKRHPEASVHTVTPSILESISALQHPNQVLLVVSMPAKEVPLPAGEWSIALDGLQDPGNMGTIIRIADWFGIRHIISSPDSVDVYNPKVVQAAMGSHLRIQFHRTDIESFIGQSDVPVLAATLEGTNVYNMSPLPAATLVIGNESQGISAAVLKKASSQVTIPKIGRAESLNAAVSAGILCALLVPRPSF